MTKSRFTIFYVLNGLLNGERDVLARTTDNRQLADGHYAVEDGHADPMFGPCKSVDEVRELIKNYSGPWTFALPLDVDQHPFRLDTSDVSGDTARNVVTVSRSKNDELELTLDGSYECFVLRASSCGDRSGAEVLARMAQLAMSAWSA